jgi:arsenate reductase
MAEGLANRLGTGKVTAVSGGTNPTGVNHFAVKAMTEIGIDISAARSKNVNEFLGQKFNYIITLCEDARQNCPFFPGKAVRLHWDLSDPAAATGTDEEILNIFRKTRNKIKGLILDLLKTP